MNRYPLSHVIRSQRVNRIRAPWLQIIGREVAKLERVMKEAKIVTDVPIGGTISFDELEKALKEVEYMFDE